MSTSTDQVARLLALIPYLQARPGITLADAAAAFSISQKQLMADLWVAFMCGLPGGMPGDLIEVDMDAVEGEGVIRLSNAAVLSKPLRLAPHEGGARGDTTQPVVDPVAIVVRDGYAYLEAWSLDRDGWRSYRLDRIVAVV